MKYPKTLITAILAGMLTLLFLGCELPPDRVTVLEQQVKDLKQQQSLQSQDAPVKALLPFNFVKTFEGTLDNQYPVIMTLRKEGSQLTGTYLYKKVGQSLELKGTIEDQGVFNLYEYDTAGNQTGVFKGQLSQSTTLSGNWMKPNGDKNMPFYLTVSVKAEDDFKKAEVAASPSGTAHSVEVKKTSIPLTTPSSSTSTQTITTPKPITTTYEKSVPQGATARCKDGSLSYSAHRQGTCSHHGGVASWL